jgi:hypothetical protein
MAQMESLRVHHLAEIESIHRDHEKELKGAQCVFDEQIALTRRAEGEHQRGYLSRSCLHEAHHVVWPKIS